MGLDLLTILMVGKVQDVKEWDWFLHLSNESAFLLKKLLCINRRDGACMAVGLDQWWEVPTLVEANMLVWAWIRGESFFFDATFNEGLLGMWFNRVSRSKSGSLQNSGIQLPSADVICRVRLHGQACLGWLEVTPRVGGVAYAKVGRDLFRTVVPELGNML